MSQRASARLFQRILFMAPLLGWTPFSVPASAQLQPVRATPPSQVAVYGFGPNGSLAFHGITATSATPVWVDTQVKTIIEGWTEYNPTTCTDISTGSFTVPTAPQHGKLFFDTENGTLANGDCPGITFPFAVARYTWTDANQTVLQDPFTLQWTTPDGMFNQVDNWTAQLAKVAQAHSIWWVCGVTRAALPNTATLTLQNPPSGASSYVWTITGGAKKLAFSNSTNTITTTTNSAGVKTLAASMNMKDVSMNVVVNGLTYLFRTTVRTPKQLKSRADLSSDQGRGANCKVSGTQGYLSLIGYEIDDQFGVNTTTPDGGNAGINEKLGPKTNSQPNNWRIPAEGGANTSSGVFQDQLCTTTAVFTPNPQPPQTPLTTNLVDQIGQVWFAGDSTNPADHKGCEVQTDTIARYIDHGRHINIVSPAIAAGVAAQAAVSGGAIGTSHPVPVLNVRSLAEQSPVIVKGRVLELGANTGGTRTASFQVDSVLKGNVDSGVITIQFAADPNLSTITLDRHEYALLFLAKEQNGWYAFADPQTGKMPITSRNVPQAEGARSTAAKLEAELLASLGDPDREVAWAALEQVGNLGHVGSTQAIRDIATLGVPAFQGQAYIALLRLGDYSMLNQAIRFVEGTVDDAELRRLQFGVAEAISDIKDRSQLPVLKSLLASPSVSLRRAAAKALRFTSDPSSAARLVQALDDTDSDVRYDAMMALAALDGAASENAPARDLFDRQPARYLARWKTWWETSGRQKYQPDR